MRFGSKIRGTLFRIFNDVVVVYSHREGSNDLIFVHRENFCCWDRGRKHYEMRDVVRENACVGAIEIESLF